MGLEHRAQTHLLGEKTEALVLTDTFISLSEYRVEWLTSCSVVSGRVARDSESGDQNLSRTGQKQMTPLIERRSRSSIGMRPAPRQQDPRLAAAMERAKLKKAVGTGPVHLHSHCCRQKQNSSKTYLRVKLPRIDGVWTAVSI